jgi:hypothetical protein
MQIKTAWQCISPGMSVKGVLRRAVCPMQWMVLMICCRMVGKRVGT